jgi:hypothetical protein
MAEAYIIDAIRSPVGRRRGGLATVHPADLGGHVLRALVERNDIDPRAVEDVIFGCVDTIGPQAGDVARTCWLAAGLPDEVPGTTIDRQCGSAQQAAHFAFQGVMSGTHDVLIAGGVQNMSMIPISASMLAGETYGFADPFSTSQGWLDRYGTQEVSQFRAAEMIAEKWDCSRQDMERFALESHRRAIQAIDEGRFVRSAEIASCASALPPGSSVRRAVAPCFSSVAISLASVAFGPRRALSMRISVESILNVTSAASPPHTWRASESKLRTFRTRLWICAGVGVAAITAAPRRRRSPGRSRCTSRRCRSARSGARARRAASL